MNLATATDPRSPAYTPGIKRPPNLKALTSIRFFAALHVAFYHMVRPFSRWGIFAGALGVGYSGVSFFFILSGFILTYSHGDEYEAGRGSAVKFWVARFARIYPIYAVSMIFAGITGSDAFHARIHIVAYIMDFLLIQSWSMRSINFFNVPAWTLSAEAFFYFVFPFLVLRMRPSSARRAIVLTALCWILAMAGPLVVLLRYPTVAMHELAPATAPGRGVNFFISRHPIFMVPEFMAGIALGWHYLRFRPSRATAAAMATAGAVLTAIAYFFSDSLPYLLVDNGLLIPLYAMLLIGLSEDNWLSRLLSAPLLVLLGEASFSLYLFHFVFNDHTQWLFGHDHTIPSAILQLVILIPMSVLLHLYVERPCRRIILDWWRKRHPNQLALIPENARPAD